MATKLITDTGRKAIKKMAQISQVARALNLMPTAEDFAMRLIGDMKSIAKMVNNISIRINEILDRYSSIPSEFLLEGFEELLKRLDDISDYAKFAIKETSDVLSNTVKSVGEMTNALGDALSATTSATLQIGSGVTYGYIAMSANITLAMTGEGRVFMTNDVVQDVVDGKVDAAEMKEEFENRIDISVGGHDDIVDSIRDWTETAAIKSTEYIDDVFDKSGGGINKALNWIDDATNGADKLVDDTIGELIEEVEKAKETVEEKIERVRDIFNNLTKQFDQAFGFVNGKNFAEDAIRNASNTAYEKMDSPIFDAVGEVTEEMADFIKNFNIGKVITAIGGIVVGAGVATLAMDTLPRIDVDRMLRDVIGGVDSYRIDKIEELYHNKYYEYEPDLLDVPGVPWLLSKDDLEKYNSDGYEEFLKNFKEENEALRTKIDGYLSSGVSSIFELDSENSKKVEENKSAIVALRKVRRDAIAAKQTEKYIGFLNTELEYLKRECLDIKTKFKNEWDSMMQQYRNAVIEIESFFSSDGGGGSEIIDRCCDRINDDTEQIVELCKSIATELTNAVAMVPIPYAIGTCVDMIVHKVLAFFKDIKIIITFLKNLIRLGIDIISQLTILAKLICNGTQSLAEIMQKLKELIGVDTILNMIDYLVALFRPKMIDAKILLENSISPIYYNETEDYENRITALEKFLEDEKDGGNVETFKYTDDPYARRKYRKTFGGSVKSDDEIEDILEELEAKGEREIVAYRSPILTDDGEDFAGWIFYHADAYDDMKKDWSNFRKRIKNRLIKRASERNKLVAGRLIGGVARLKNSLRFGYYEDGEFIKNSVSGFDAYYWYTKWTNDPTDCEPDFTVKDNENVVSPIQTTANGSLVELNDGRRVFVEGKIVKSGDFVNVNGVKYRVK